MAEQTQQDNTQGTSLGTYFDAYNPSMLQVRHPELRFRKEMIDPNFSWNSKENKDFLYSLPIDDFERVLEARSLDHANLLLQRNQVVKDGEKKIQENDSWWQQVPQTLLAGTVDASILIPGSFAFKAFKGANAIGRYSNAFLRTGTAGAVGGIAYEAEKGVQGIDTNYATAATYGFFLGGGIGVGLEAFGRSLYKRKLADSLQSTELEDRLHQDNSVFLTNVEGSDIPRYTWTTGEVGKLPKVPDLLFPNFMKSDVSKLYESDSNDARKLISRLFAPAIATRDGNGVPIPVGITADDKSNLWKGYLNTARLDIGMAHRDAVVAGYKGSVDDFNNEIGVQLRKAMSEQEKAAYAYANSFDDYYAKPGSKTYTKAEEEFTKPGSTQTEFTIPTLKNPDKSKLFKERVDKYYADNPVTIKSGNPHIDKATNAHINYYKKMLETSKKLGMSEVKNINVSKLYAPRVYDWAKIRQMDAGVLREKVKQALIQHPANAKLIQSPENLDKVLDEIVTKFQNIDKATEFVDFSYIVPKELPLSTHFKKRKLKLDDSVMEDLFISDADTIMGLYHYKQQGMMKAQYAFGTTSKQKIIDNFISPIRESLSPEELGKISQALENVVSDTLGTLRIPKNGNSLGWQTSRVLAQANSLTYGGSFGINSITDIVSSLLATDTKAMFTHNFLPLIKGVHSLMFKGDKASLELMNEFVAMGNLQSVFSMKGANRVIDTDNVFNASKLEHGMMGLTDKYFKYNGLRGITAMFEAMVGGNAVMDIRKLGKSASLSTKEQARLARWGLSHDEAKRMSKLIDTNAEFKGKALQKLNIEKWSEGDLDILQTAITRAIHSGVIQGDTIHIPSWMIVPDAVRKLVFQFLKVPIAAHEILLRRGWSEDKAGLAAGALGSILAYATITYLKEQAFIAAGLVDKNEAKYDVVNGGEEAWFRLLGKSINYSAQLGAFTTGVTYAAALSGQPEIGREYANDPTSVLGPSIGRLGQVRDIIKPLLEGRVDDTKQAFAVKNLMPLLNAPIINEAASAYIKANTY